MSSIFLTYIASLQFLFLRFPFLAGSYIHHQIFHVEFYKQVQLSVCEEFMPLYSCLCTVRERYRSQNCDHGASRLVRYEAVFQVVGQSQWQWGLVPTCHSVHSWWLYSAASLGHQVAGSVTCYPTQFHYPDTDLTSPYPILIMLSGLGLGIDKYQF